MKHIQLYEKFAVDEVTQDRIQKSKSKMDRSGDFQIFITNKRNLDKFMKSGSIEASIWKERMSDTQVKVYLPNNEDVKGELLHLTQISGLIPADLNSLDNKK